MLSHVTTDGVILGLICTAIVWVIGFIFVDAKAPKSGSIGDNIYGAWVWFLRSALGVVSVVAIILMSVMAQISATPAGTAFFYSWVLTYTVGVVAYFFTRYAFGKR